MLCALLQFGSLVSAVNRPSPPTARTRRSAPRTALSKRFSSESSSISSKPEAMTIGEPIMSSQKIGPSSLVSRTRSCTGAAESSDSMLPTTGFVGGCGIGLNLLLDAIVEVSPALSQLTPSLRGAKRRSNPCFPGGWMDRFARNDDVARYLPKPSSTPFDQFRTDLFRLFLLRPMAAVFDQIFFEIRHELFHAVSSRRRQHRVVLRHDH